MGSIAFWQYIQFWIRLRCSAFGGVENGVVAVDERILVLHVLLQHPFQGSAHFNFLARILSGSHEQRLAAMHHRRWMDDRLAHRRWPYPTTTSQRIR
jgi:hypothetical protein